LILFTTFVIKEYVMLFLFRLLFYTRIRKSRIQVKISLFFINSGVIKVLKGKTKSLSMSSACLHSDISPVSYNFQAICGTSEPE